jgi:hypothetical protein
MTHKTDLRYDLDTGEYRVKYSDSVEPFLREAKLDRDKEEAGMFRKDAPYRRIGTITFTEVLRIKAKHGVDLTNLRDKTERRKALQIIESEYPYLKTTNMRLA